MPIVGVQQATSGKWRVLVGDQYGNTITNVSPVAFGKVLVQALNRPAQFSFSVPSADARVATLASDGYPFVSEGRTVRAYRQETQQDGSTKWVVRFTGYVWQLEDAGDEQGAMTTVTCFDPFQMLAHRYARVMAWSITAGDPLGLFISQTPGGLGEAGAGPFLQFGIQDLTDMTNVTGVYTPRPGTDIARGLLNCSNNTDGFTGLLDYFPSNFYQGSAILPVGSAGNSRDGQEGLYPTGYAPNDAANVRPPASASASPTYDHTMVGQAIIDLTAMANGFDFEVVPLDVGTAYAGYIGGGIITDYPTIDGIARHMLGRMAVFQALAKFRLYAGTRGATLPNVRFDWGHGGNSAAQVRRTVDLEQLINNAYAVGTSTFVNKQTAASINRFGAFNGEVSATDTDDPALLGAYAVEAMALAAQAAVAYSVVPTPGKCPLPFDNFNLGDTITISAGPALRGGFTSLQRVHGFTLTMPDDTPGEILTEVITGAQS